MERLCTSQETQYKANELAIHVARYLPLRGLVRGKRVLDIACGVGYASRILSEWGASEVVGVDTSQDAIKFARNNYASSNVKFVQGDAVEFLHSRRKSFDVVISIETIEHVDDPASFLRGIRQAVRDDGVVYISCPNDEWYYGRGRSLNQYHKTVMSFEQFRARAESALGSAVDWYYGTLASGFATVSLRTLSPDVDWTSALAPEALQAVPEAMWVSPQRELAVDAMRNLYFAGLWIFGSDIASPPLGSVAVIPNHANFRQGSITTVPEFLQRQSKRHVVLLARSDQSDAPYVRAFEEALSDRVDCRLHIVDQVDDFSALSKALSSRPAYVHFFHADDLLTVFANPDFVRSFAEHLELDIRAGIDRLAAPVVSCSPSAQADDDLVVRAVSDILLDVADGTGGADAVRTWLQTLQVAEGRAKAGGSSYRRGLIALLLKR